MAYGVARDDDGYFRTDEIHLTSPTSAITSDSLDLGGTPGDADWLTERGDFATVSLDLQPAGSGPELFAGIGPTADVTSYLASVAHDQVTDYDDSNTTVTYERQDGSAIPAPPGDQTFWVAQVATAQPGALTWDVRGGDWTVVVMNADGSPGIDATARVGIKIDWLLPVAIVLLVVGAVMLVGGTLVAVFVGRRRGQQPPLAPADASTLPPPPGPDVPPPPGDARAAASGDARAATTTSAATAAGTGGGHLRVRPGVGVPGRVSAPEARRGRRVARRVPR